MPTIIEKLKIIYKKDSKQKLNKTQQLEGIVFESYKVTVLRVIQEAHYGI